MNRSIEEGLRRVMVALGRLLEQGIEKMKRTRMKVETRGGVRPILSLESKLTLEKLQQLTNACEERMLNNINAVLQGKQALEICHESRMLRYLMSHGAKTACALETNPEHGSLQQEWIHGFKVKGSPFALPFHDHTIDYMIVRGANFPQRDPALLFKELSRVFSPGGQGIFLDYHPFSMHAKYGNPQHRPHSLHIRGIEDYFKLARQHGLRVVDVREAFLDEEVRKYFREEEISVYRELKGTPLIVGLYLYKPKQ